jgi:hypothetical protein
MIVFLQLTQKDFNPEFKRLVNDIFQIHGEKFGDWYTLDSTIFVNAVMSNVNIKQDIQFGIKISEWLNSYPSILYKN